VVHPAWLSFALTHLTTAHLFCHGNLQCPYWTSRPTGMKVGTKACQSDGISLAEHGINRLIWTVCRSVSSWGLVKRMFVKFCIASCYCDKKVKYNRTLASQEYYFILALKRSWCSLYCISFSCTKSKDRLDKDRELHYCWFCLIAVCDRYIDVIWYN
jgi:hypothetical protein